MTTREIEECAYRMVGSAPCEDCKRFRECDDSDTECDELSDWRAKYNEALKELIHGKD